MAPAEMTKPPPGRTCGIVFTDADRKVDRSPALAATHRVDERDGRRALERHALTG